MIINFLFAFSKRTLTLCKLKWKWINCNNFNELQQNNDISELEISIILKLYISTQESS